MDIKSLRAMRSSSTDFSKITKELEKVANPGSQSQEDNRFWKPERDKAGNASAVIRFLAKTEKDELPWVRVYSHGFQGPTGRWYIEDSLSTIGLEDGVSVLNRELWNSGIEADKEQARKQKRRLNYIANILVVSDPKHPENEGKVFLFKFGKKIFDKIMDAARPTFDDVTPVNVFDYWEGANFRLRMKQVDGYPNYDQSVFDSPSALEGGDDEKILEIANKQYFLGEFIDPKKFKSREELDRKLAAVMNGTGSKVASAEAAIDSQFDSDNVVEEVKTKVTAKASTSKVADDGAIDVDSYFDGIMDED